MRRVSVMPLNNYIGEERVRFWLLWILFIILCACLALRFRREKALLRKNIILNVVETSCFVI